jgi:hypothetical protein
MLQYCKNFTLDDVVKRFLNVVRAQSHSDWVEGGVRNEERNLKKRRVKNPPFPPCLELTHMHRKWAKQWAMIKGKDSCDPTYDPTEDANP